MPVLTLACLAPSSEIEKLRENTFGGNHKIGKVL